MARKPKPMATWGCQSRKIVDELFRQLPVGQEGDARGIDFHGAMLGAEIAQHVHRARFGRGRYAEHPVAGA